MLTREQAEERRRQLISEEEANGEVSWWWLSFATEDGFRGVAIVKAKGFASAHLATSVLGINPGGQIQGLEFNLPEHVNTFIEKYSNRLLNKEECKEFDDGMDKLMKAN